MTENEQHDEPECPDEKGNWPAGLSAEECELIEKWHSRERKPDDDLLSKREKGWDKRLEQIGKEMRTYIEKGIQKSTRQRKTGRLLPTPFYRIAAVITGLLGIAGLILWQQHTSAEVIVLKNEKTGIQQFILPDGTRVWLNKNTVAEYQRNFSEDERRFTLRDGEVFFEVQPDSLRPFHVDADGFTVRVLGTSFSVKNIGGIPVARVTVSSGKVTVLKIDGEPPVLLENDQLILDKDARAFSLRKVDAAEADAWRHGWIHLEEVPFPELIRSLETSFDIRISYAEKALSGQYVSIHYSASDDITSILEIIRQIYGIDYTVNGKTIVLK